MKLNELNKCLYHYRVDDRYKRSSGDDNDHNTNSSDVLVDFSTYPDPEIVEWMTNARRSQQEDCGRLADKDYDSFSSEDHDYLKAKIAFLCLVFQATSVGMIMEVKILSMSCLSASTIILLMTGTREAVVMIMMIILIALMC